MTDYDNYVNDLRNYLTTRQIADLLEAQAKEIAEKDARIAELEAALKKSDDALSWLILETCNESYQNAYPQIYADLINANIAGRAALKGEKPSIPGKTDE